MFYTLTQEELFLNKPETGMGYQVIEASVYGSYLKSKYIILNSQIAVDIDSNVDLNVKKVVNLGIFSAKLVSEKITFSSDIKVFSEKEFRSTLNEAKPYLKRGAIENEKQNANGTEKLVRLSAFQDDRRIDKTNNCLRPGSFTTSYDDYRLCKTSNQDPINRYALPNNDAIEWVFNITPTTLDIYQLGFVQPANNKEGGGIEYYFENGTSKNTFFPPETKY